MIKKLKIFSKNNNVNQIKYNWYEIDEALTKFDEIFNFSHTIHNNQLNTKGYKSYCTKKGKYPQFIDNIHCGFDIETTKIDNEKTFMYCWQFCVFSNNEYNVIVGTYWYEFIDLIDLICDKLAIENHNLIIWVANLGYEWQFMKHHLIVTNSFFKELREPVEIEHKNYILFKECLSWGGSLKKLANDYTNLIKLKGDLDYSIYRESYKVHTQKEQFYCDFDVLILAQFSQWYEKQYLINGLFPKTTTGALRLLIKKDMEKDINKIYKRIARQYPYNMNEYNKLMNFVYRGGYTHGNMIYMNEIIKNVYSVDFTSSYPSVMLYEKFPYSFNKCDPQKYNIDDIINLSVDFAFYGLFEFSNVKTTTYHSIESLNKCFNIQEVKDDKETIIDNGRIQRTSKLQVYLTEQDLLTYIEFMKWDTVKILELHISRKQYLPLYLIKKLCEMYTGKAVLKQQFKPYAIEKTYCNANYGMCVTRQVIENIIWNDETKEITTEHNKSYNNYDEYKKNKFLLPQWGVWISAIARRNLLKNVYNLEHKNKNVHVLYCDTDSIKYIGEDKAQVIENYNKEIVIKRDNALERLKELNLDKSLYYDLGMFDNETQDYNNGVIKYFKMYGAKRYIYFAKKGKKDIYSCTVAGLPKQSYYKYCSNNIVKFFGDFNEHLIVKNCKLCSNYNDNSFEIKRNGKKEIIYSCLTLNNIDFNMTFDKDWLYLINSEYVNIREHRI